MRPEQKAPDNLAEVAFGLQLTSAASMRPEQKAPDNNANVRHEIAASRLLQ